MVSFQATVNHQYLLPREIIPYFKNIALSMSLVFSPFQYNLLTFPSLLTLPVLSTVISDPIPNIEVYASSHF